MTESRRPPVEVTAGEDAYFGDPTAASAEDGEASFEALGDILSLSIMEHLGSKA